MRSFYLHSNMVLFKSWAAINCTFLNSFTFQYGSIQIVASITVSIISLIFTFQYGSIQITYIILLILSFFIYIPIWFYSNGVFLWIKNGLKQHLHSNMVLFKSIVKFTPANVKKIYIPIWFYSNFIPNVNENGEISIYIPIWFYSNTINKNNHRYMYEFTFQYGSIQMIKVV